MITNQLNKSYGVNTAVSAADITVPKKFPTGSLSLDVILGGGLPGNAWTEIRGLKSAGKTSLMFKCIAANQRQDPDFIVMWVAAEGYDTDQARALGVDNSRVIVVTTQDMELAFQAMLDAAESKEVDMIILDSYPALVPGEEDEKAMDEFTTAMGARLMNKFIRKAGKATARAADGSERAMTGVIINQYRDAIGTFSRYGVPQTTPGGKGKEYFYNTIIKIAKDEWIEEKRPGVKDAVKVGQVIKLTTEKCKSAPPMQAVSLDFYFREAPLLGFKRGDFDTAKDFFNMAVLFGVVQKKGGWYYFRDNKWQGKDKTLAAIYADQELQDDIAELVLSAAKNPALAYQLVNNDNEEE